MMGRIRNKKLWVFFLVGLAFFSCEKKAAQADEAVNVAQLPGIETERTGDAPELVNAVPIVEGPYLNENDVVVNRPVPGIVPFNPQKDVVQNNLDLDDLKTIITIYRWDMAFEGCAIKFKPDGTYSIWAQSFGYFIFGEYEASGNSVIMRYPSRIDDIFNAVAYASQVQDRLFDGEKDRVLVYDKAYRTKSIVTCLRYGDLMLKNYALQSPYGEEYEIDGLAVIKYNDIETLVEVQENLRMRESPDINAAAVTLHAITRDDFGRQILTDNARRNVVETGERFSYDQKTVKEDTIDGITAPWYHIIVPISDDFSSAVWVFGGYLKVYR